MSFIKVTHGEQMQKIYIELAPDIEITMYRESAHMLYRELKYVLQAIDELPIAESAEPVAQSITQQGRLEDSTQICQGIVEDILCHLIRSGLCSNRANDSSLRDAIFRIVAGKLLPCGTVK